MADELKTVLGFEAKDAIATLATLSKSLNTYSAAMSQAASATGSFNKSAAGIEKNIAGLAPTTKKAATETNKLGKATGIVVESMKKYGKTVSKLPSIHPAIKKQREAFEKLGKQSKKTSKTMILSWESVVRIGVMQVFHQLVSKITSSIGEAGRAAMKLEIQFAEIQTIGGVLKDSFEGVSSSVRALSDEFGVSSDIVAEGIYQTLSNQVAEAEKSFVFFAAAAEFSIAAVTSADSAVNLLSSTINAFGYNANQAAVISGKLFKTIELGRIRGEEFANTFGRVAVLANKLGISLDEVLASIATLTISGLKYDEAFTLITNTMLKLIRPSAELKKVYKELGIETIEAAIQAYGFQGTLQKLVDTTDGTVTELGDLFTRVRALRGILGLTGNATEKFVKNLEAIREAGIEEIFEAKELIFKTNAKHIQIELNQLKNAVIFDFGRPTLSVINKVIEHMGGLVSMTQTVAAGFGVAAIAATGLVIAFHPYIALAAAAGTATIYLITQYRKFTKTAIQSIKERVRAEEKAIATINAAEGELAENRIRMFNKQLGMLQRYVIERQAAINKHLIVAQNVEEYIREDFNNQLSNKAKAFDKFVDALEERMEQGKDNINSIQSEIFSLQRELSQVEFGGATQWEDDITRATILLKRGASISSKMRQEFRKGNYEQAKSYESEAKSLFEQAKTIGQNKNNSALIYQAQKASKKIINDKIRLLKNQEKQEQRIIAESGEQAQVKKQIGKEINHLVKLAKKVKLFGTDGIEKTKEEIEAELFPIIAEIQVRLDKVGAEFNIFKNLEDIDSTNITDKLTEALKPIDDFFTGKPISLGFAVEKRYIDVIFKNIQKIADKPANAIEIRIKEITGLDITKAVDLKKAQLELVNISETLKDTERSTSDLEGQQQAYNTSMGNLPGILEIVRKKVEQGAIFFDSYGANIDGVTDSMGRMVPEQVANTLQTIEQAAVSVLEQLDDFTDPEKYVAGIKSLEHQAAALEAIGNVDAAEGLRTFIEEAKKAQEAGEGIDVKIEGKETLDDMRGKLRGTIQDFKDLKPAANEGAQGVTSAMGTVISGVNTTTQAVVQLRQALGSLTGGTITTAHFGKLIHRAQGGDTIPAMLSPGEFVVNADSSRKFFSQLVAINSGVQPRFSEGGSVTNVGDININVHETVSAKQTARETMGAFRRELRRNTGRL